MTTKQLLETVAIYDILYQKYANFPLLFNIKLVSCETVTDPKQLKLFLVTVAACIFTTLCCYVTVIGYFFQHPVFLNIDLWKILIFVTLTLVNTGLLIFQYSVYFLCRWIPAALRYCLAFERQLRRRMRIPSLILVAN